MQAKILTQNGVKNYISGMDLNVRYEKDGKRAEESVQTILERMDVQPEEFYTGIQCHGKRVEYADGERGEDFVYGKTFDATDGLYTDKKDVALMVKFADCTPVVLYDPINEVLGAVHSGWRGTVQRISAELIKKMEENFGSARENLIAYLGPSIDIDHYEVGLEVYDAFTDFENRDEFFTPKGEKYHLSMIDANLDILLQEGLQKENIEVSRESTWESPHLHSSRQEGKDYQLNAMVVMMPSD